MRWLDKLKAKNELKFFEGEEVENGHKNIVLGMVREKVRWKQNKVGTTS